MLEAIWASLDTHASRLKSNTLFRGVARFSRLRGVVLDFWVDFLMIARVDFGVFGVVSRIFSLRVFSSLEFFGVFLGVFRDIESSLDSIYRSLFTRFCGRFFGVFCGGICGECRASRLWERLTSKANSAEVIEAIEIMGAMTNFIVWSGILSPLFFASIRKIPHCKIIVVFRVLPLCSYFPHR